MSELSNAEPRSYSRTFDKSRMRRRRSSVLSAGAKSPKREGLSALVVDNGAYSVKVGLSTAQSPTLVPNCIMKAKSERKRLFIGAQINECRDCSGLYFLLPCERGYITKWDVQKPVWDYVFSRNVHPVEDKPVVMTQPLFNFKSIQDCIDEIFFEEYEVPSMFRPNPTDLSKLKYQQDNKLSNNLPCIIVDSGFSFTHVIPYINGNKYLRAIRRLNVGGKLLTNHLKDLISYRQYNVMEETYVINQVKEDTCYISNNVLDELKLASTKNNPIVRNYVLPDFNNIRRGYIQDPNDVNQKEIEENCQILKLNNERFVVPEILFHPSDIGMKSAGLAEAVVDSIFRCPEHARRDLAKHVVLSGGNCKFPGFRDRMYAELRSYLPHDWEVGVYMPDDPVGYSWKGGSALLKVPNFKNLLVTKSEYEEFGSTITQQRFNSWMTDNSEPDSESSEPEISFSYLDNIKGRSIFGKNELGNNDSKFESNTNESDSLGSDSKTDSNDGTNQIPETTENDINTEHSTEQSSNGFNELMNSVDLFPFGTNTYL
ncbi:unnamed protein product [Phyllotreta striolata]|uniref:Actin-related protein 6 n=1 Tax=Phyllotreta striolata TaxID=444603 RepID=A0A9N9TLG4_PHYSR|nr:unnamed protein product [Phyllotreta striolata]